MYRLLSKSTKSPNVRIEMIYFNVGISVCNSKPYGKYLFWSVCVKEVSEGLVFCFSLLTAFLARLEVGMGDESWF